MIRLRPLAIDYGLQVLPPDRNLPRRMGLEEAVEKREEEGGGSGKAWRGRGRGKGGRGGDRLW